MSIGIVKGDTAREQLIDDRAKDVKVDGLRVPGLLDHFGGQVCEGPAKRVRVLALHVLFRQTEVCEYRMAFLVQDYVFRLEVSVYDILIVDFFDCQKNLSHVKLNLVFRESLKKRNFLKN